MCQFANISFKKKKENRHQPVSHYDGSDDEVQTLTVPVNSWGWGSSFQPLIYFVSVRSSLFPILSDLKPGRLEKISFHTSNVRRVLGWLRELLTHLLFFLTDLYALTPQGLDRGLGRSFSDVEGYYPPEWDVFTSRVLLIRMNVLLSPSSPLVWRGNASAAAVSL